ncbi:CapA family protein [Metabacillus iocasae]|uniref:Poly-gamma-glutamate synthesis protein (Capsule biosynthesis protein) n=1 Tax=Priestia iocasae TaxID=2291674 RepID=A0ABS2QRR6_9BACI|nr:poly-gamma-glutamate synthesis protein (capsule biosynthesis protein) [Metabacillus iocasae]
MERYSQQKRNRKRRELQIHRVALASVAILSLLLIYSVYHLLNNSPQSIASSTNEEPEKQVEQIGESEPIKEEPEKKDLSEVEQKANKSKQEATPEKKATTSTESHEPITISFAGDVLLDKSIGHHIATNGVDYPFKHVAPYFQRTDLAALNLETSVSTRGTPDGKQFTFRSKPETLKGVANAGVDVVSLANNHTLDYGVDALFDTMKHLKEHQIGYTGAGENEREAYQAYYREVNGKTVAILGISRVLPDVSWFAKGEKPGIAQGYHDEPMMTYVKEAVEKADYTIVMIHWNRELQDYPEAYAREMGKKFIDAGVNAIIGGHSHSLMGIEHYKGAPIYYSLGNFVFTDSSSNKGHETMIVEVKIDNQNISTKIIPFKIVNNRPQPMDDTYNRQLIEKLNNISYNARIDLDGNVFVSEE